MKKALYVILITSALLFTGCSKAKSAETTKSSEPKTAQSSKKSGIKNMVNRKDLQKGEWSFTLEKKMEPLKHFVATFDGQTMLLAVDLEKTKTDPEQIWENNGRKTPVKDLQLKVDYTFTDNKIHLKNEVLQLDADYTVKKDRNDIVFVPVKAKKDVETITLKPHQKKQIPATLTTTKPVIPAKPATPAVAPAPSTEPSTAPAETPVEKPAEQPAERPVSSAPEQSQPAEAEKPLQERLEMVYNDYVTKLQTAADALLIEYKNEAPALGKDTQALYDLYDEKYKKLMRVQEEGNREMLTLFPVDSTYVYNFKTYYVPLGEKLVEDFHRDAKPIYQAYLDFTRS